ncbi:MAG: sulfite exporter TauE/SafE family protein [Runella sp.]
MLFIAFITGLVGSLHCVGMCGPLALALPVGQHQVLIKRLVYTFGRILSYAALGVAFGLVSEQLFWAGLQQKISILAGVILLLLILLPYSSGHHLVGSWIGKYSRRFFERPGLRGFFGAGLLNGLLPCGMVYVALTGAVATGSWQKAVLFMIFFGVGTAPLLIAVGLLNRFLTLNLRRRLHRVLPVYQIVLAVFLIIRGLNLGIPYLSPHATEGLSEGQVSVCHSTPQR